MPDSIRSPSLSNIAAPGGRAHSEDVASAVTDPLPFRWRRRWCHSQAIQRAFHSAAALPQHVRIDHGGRDVVVPQQLLNRPNVRPALEGMGGEAVSKSVRAGALDNPHSRDRRLDGLMNGPLVQMMPPLLPGARVH